MSEATLWAVEPHTAAKHAILRRYLDAWLPIMSKWNRRIVFIDGFAGPGRYSGGEDGSPIVALKAALEHRQRLASELVYVFVEADEARKTYLDGEIASLTLQSSIHVTTRHAEFDETLTGLLDEVERAGRTLAPTFAFVDPFGWSDIPFSLIARLLSNPRCEVLVNLMYQHINRFLGDPRYEAHWDRLFGTPNWREITAVRNPDERRRLTHDLYRRQLETGAKTKFTRSFEMRNRNNVTEYFLFFASNDATGLLKMKEAMWKVDPNGAFRFSDATVTDHPVLFGPAPDFVRLRLLISERFAGTTVSVEEVERYVVEETAFLDTHYKTQVLKILESQSSLGLQIVSAPPSRRRGQFPPGTMLRFS